MKIAQIAPLALRVPPKKYGGTERMIYSLTEELVKHGHDVTLFASGDSSTTAKLSSVLPKSSIELGIKDPYGANFMTMLHIGVAYQRAEEFDVIHDHNGHFSLPTANLSKTPVVFTLHGALTLQNKRVYEELTRPYLIAISEAQKRGAPDLNYIATIHHGLHMESYPFSMQDEGFLLFVGRISAEKGIHHAIDVAEYLGLPLYIAAKVDDVDMKYFKEYIEPRLSDKIRWIGEVSENTRNHLMSRALAFLHPAQWREPFGLSLIEAMACGAPVVAFRRGSIPELVIHGKTGFVVEDSAEMVYALKKIKDINRFTCRAYALERFSARRMTKEYETVYKKAMHLWNKRDDKTQQYLKAIKQLPEVNGNHKEKYLQ